MALEHIESANLLPNHTFVLHLYNSECNQNAATDASASIARIAVAVSCVRYALMTAVGCRMDRLFAGHNTLPRKFGVYGAACTGACKASSDVSRNFHTINMAQLWCASVTPSPPCIHPLTHPRE